MALALPDFYEVIVAVDPVAGGGEGRLLPNAEFQVFNVGDTAFTSPLRCYEHESGVEITTLRSNQFAVTPRFRVEGDPTEVVFRSGAYVMRVMSVFGPLRAAGFDPEPIATAVAAGPIAVKAAEDAAASASAAAVARDQAVEAAENLDLSVVDARVEEYLTENPPSGGASIVALTQAEYDALSPEEKGNPNVWYAILDGAVPAGWPFRDDFAVAEAPPVALDTGQVWRVESGVWSQESGGLAAAADGAIIVVDLASQTQTVEYTIGGVLPASGVPTIVLRYDNSND